MTASLFDAKRSPCSKRIRPQPAGPHLLYAVMCIWTAKQFSAQAARIALDSRVRCSIRLKLTPNRATEVILSLVANHGSALANCFEKTMYSYGRQHHGHRP